MTLKTEETTLYSGHDFCKVQFPYLLGFMFDILLTEWYITCT